jgi:hypothetical protein
MTLFPGFRVVAAFTSVALACFATACAGHARAGVDETAIAPRVTVDCRSAIASEASPMSNARVVLRRAALPRENLSPLVVYQPDVNATYPFRAKQGIQIRAGRSDVRIIVPASLRSVVALSWAGAPLAKEILFRGCDRTFDSQWLAFAGAFYLKHRACISLNVRVGSRRAVAFFALGRPCHATR